MPFSGRAEVVESKAYICQNTGQQYSVFTSWKPDSAVLTPTGWDIYWTGDGTVGRCKQPFKTEQEAIDFAANWNAKFDKKE